jgi:glycosyltransferase involved in cell wall biosynthesis
MAKYSIILPVRNGGHYVKQCINSILEQTLTDFNLHVLDNQSADGTVDWVKTLEDPRIILKTSDISLTIEQSWARILGIEKNEFITLIGHDDFLDKDYLATMDALIDKYPDASLYQTHFRFIDAQGDLIRKCKPMVEIQSAPEFLASFLQDDIDIMGTGFMMRARDYDEAGGLPDYPSLLFADFELWLKLTEKGYIATAPEECFAFRRHLSTTTTSADSKMQQAFSRWVNYLVSLRNNPGYKEVIDLYAAHYMRILIRGLAHRTLRTPLAKRNGITVAGFLEESKLLIERLLPGTPFNPEDQLNIRMAKWIDGNPLTRSAFLAFKRIYHKPLYS